MMAKCALASHTGSVYIISVLSRERRASYSCSFLADLLGFVRAEWLMWLRDFHAVLDAIGCEYGCECCVSCLMRMWCANVVWICLLVCVGTEAGWAGKMPFDPVWIEEKKKASAGAPAKDCPYDFDGAKAYATHPKGNLLCECGYPPSAHAKAQAPAAAGTPPTERCLGACSSWCALSRSYACLWSCAVGCRCWSSG